MPRSVLTRWAKRLDHPYSAWVVIRAITLALGALKLLASGHWNVTSAFWCALGGLWVGGLALYPLYRARGKDSLPDDPLDPYWCRPARPSRWQRRWLWLERRRLLPVLEIGASSLFLLASGGLHSPFHEFCQSSLVAPALQYGLRGAGFSTAYLLALYALLLQPLRPLQAVHWHLLFSPFQTALVSALLGLMLAQQRQHNLMAEEMSRNEERHRLIQELHDGSAQTQYALSIALESLAEKSLAGGSVSQKSWDRLVYLSRKSLLETRQAMVDPDLIMNARASLQDLFSSLIRDFQSVSGLDVHFSVEGQPRLTPTQRCHCFRFTQEALANVFKYSQAQQVSIRIAQRGSQVRLEVEDDGQGCDLNAVNAGRGWQGMLRRAEELGGQLIRESSPGQGCRVALEWTDGYHTDRRRQS